MSKVKIGDITDSCLGKMLDAAKNKGEFAPYLANANVRWGTFDLSDLPEMRFEPHEQERYGLKYGDLVMCEGGEPVRCAIWKEEIPGMKIQKALHRIRAHEGVDVRWLYYWFLACGQRHLLDRFFIETTIKHLPGERLKEIELDLPSYEEQKNVGEVLSILDAKIDLNTRLCAELENMAKLIYDYWFVQFDFPDEHGKPYQTSGGEMVWCKELGRKVPKDWKVGTFHDLIKDIRTGLNPRQNFTFSNGTIRYLTVKNLTLTGNIDYSGCDMIDDEARDIVHRRSDIRIGDVLFASIAPLGRCYLIQKEPRDWDINESVFSLRPNYDNCTSEYLYMTLKSDLFIMGSTNSSTGSIFKGIRINTLLDMPTLIPPHQILLQFTDCVGTWLRMQENAFSESDELSHLRDWLLPMLMNGQAKVEKAKEEMK